jgi:hypothetical protein
MNIVLLIIAILFGYIMSYSGMEMTKSIWFAVVGVPLFIFGVVIMSVSSLSLICLMFNTLNINRY